jgi:LPXTG-motif cell wall-anchored protein
MMATSVMERPRVARPTYPALAAMLVAVANLGYALSFLVVRPDNPDTGGTAASAFLLAGGLLALPALLALYRRVSDTNPDLALLATVLATASALGAAIHGGYDLANAINPPATATDLPNQVDPRGLLTFGAGGLSLLLFTPLLARSERKLAPIAATLGVLLLALYVLRLVVLDADNVAVVAIAAATGFVVSPVWYLWLGASLRSAATAAILHA